MDSSVCKTLEKVIMAAQKTDEPVEVIFTKGGDRFAGEIPERVVLNRFGVKIIDGLGEKTHNSSAYVRHLAPKTEARVLETA